MKNKKRKNNKIIIIISLLLIILVGVIIFIYYSKDSVMPILDNTKEIEKHYNEFVKANKESILYNEKEEEIGKIGKDVELTLNNINIDKDTKYFSIKDIDGYYIKYIDVDKIVVMVQKEVGDRFLAKPNTKEYNSLTIFINYYFNTSKLFLVSKNVFMPRPNVDSIVMKLEKKEIINKPKNEELFFKLVKDSFTQKRKTLKNNLKSYDFNKVLEVLKKYNYDENVRAEALPIDVFIEISNNL